MKIAVVDDSVEDLSAEKNYFAEYISNHHPALTADLEISGFQSSVAFLKIFSPGKFDLIALDIIMDDTDGIRLAKIIREEDKDCHIIFITNSTEFLIDGYSVFAAGYFLKPIHEHPEEFKNAFEFIVSKTEKNPELPVTVIRNMDLSVPYKDICFVDINEKHKVRITMPDRELVTTMNYSRCRDILLNDKRFLECHYRIIVNMDYVQSMKDEDFILTNGAKIPISQRRRRESKLAYMNYILHKND